MVDESIETPPRKTRVDRRRLVAERPQSRQRQAIALAVVGLSLLLITGIIVAGYVIIFVLPPKQLIVRVGDVEYTRGDLVKILRVRQATTEFLGSSYNVGTDVFQAIQQLVESVIISQSAPRFGITITDQELDAAIRDLLGFGAGLGVIKDPVQTEREFRENYGAYLNAVQLSETEHRRMMRRERLREKFRLFIGDNVPTVAEQVHLYRLVVSASDDVDVVQVKLKDALADSRSPEQLQQAFKQVVRELSRDVPEVIRNGGDLGWVPRGIYPSYDASIFGLEAAVGGAVSEPIPSVDDLQQVFFFMISERDPARELDPASRDAMKTEALQEWLNEARDSHEVFSVFNSDIYTWVIEQLRLTTTLTPQPQPTNPLGF